MRGGNQPLEGDHITWTYLKKAMSLDPSFTTNLTMIFEDLERLQHDAITYSLVHPNQYGGLMGRASIDAGLLLAQGAAMAAGVYTSILAIDIAQFFPSIQHDILLEVPKHQGFSMTTIRFLASYLSARTTRYHCADTKSEVLPFEVGIPQGCKVSPPLACLYIAPLLFSLDDLNPESGQLS